MLRAERAAVSIATMLMCFVSIGCEEVTQIESEIVSQNSALQSYNDVYSVRLRVNTGDVWKTTPYYDDDALDKLADWGLPVQIEDLNETATSTSIRFHWSNNTLSDWMPIADNTIETFFPGQFHVVKKNGSWHVWQSYAVEGLATVAEAYYGFPRESLVVVTTNALMDNSTIDDYVAFKSKTQPTYVVTEDRVYDNTGVIESQGWGNGVDLTTPITFELADGRSNGIRNWLEANQLAYKIKDLLLIGDPDSIDGDVPMKNFFCLKHYEDKYQDYWAKIYWFCTVPTADSYETCDDGDDEVADDWLPKEDENRYLASDYYYANLSYEFPTDSDGDIWDVGAIDFSLRTVNVGRVPVTNNDIASLNKILAKFIAYASSTDVSWRKNALLGMHGQAVPGDWVPFGEAIRTKILDPNQMSTFRVYAPYTDPNGNITYGDIPTSVVNMGSVWAGAAYPSCDQSLLNGSLCNETKTEFGVVAWSAHGSQFDAAETIETREATPTQYYYPRYTPYLDDSHPAFTASASCLNSYPHEDNSVAATLLKNGSIAFFGATDKSHPFNEQNPDPYLSILHVSNHDVVYGFLHELINSKLSGGAALSQLRQKMSTTVAELSDALTLDDDYKMWSAVNLLIFNLYGDPTIGLENEIIVETIDLPVNTPTDTTLDAGESTTYYANDWPSKGNPYWTANIVISVNSLSGSPIPSGTLVVNGTSYTIGGTGAYYQEVNIPDQGPYSIQLTVTSAAHLQLILGNR